MASPGSDQAPDHVAADAPEPLTEDLIARVLRGPGYVFTTDPDGDLVGRWDDNVIYIVRLGRSGEILQIRTMAGRVFTIDDVPRLYAFCNSWNHDKLWPKAYVHVGDDGTAGVYGEVTTDLEKGVTFAQLDQLIACGISTGCALAEAVAELA